MEVSLSHAYFRITGVDIVVCHINKRMFRVNSRTRWKMAQLRLIPLSKQSALLKTVGHSRAIFLFPERTAEESATISHKQGLILYQPSSFGHFYKDRDREKSQDNLPAADNPRVGLEFCCILNTASRRRVGGTDTCGGGTGNGEQVVFTHVTEFSS